MTIPAATNLIVNLFPEPALQEIAIAIFGGGSKRLQHDASGQATDLGDWVLNSHGSVCQCAWSRPRRSSLASVSPTCRREDSALY